MSRGSKLGWMLGILSGTALGVLFAPRRGEDLRRKIKTNLKKGGRGYEPLLGDLKLMGNEVVESAKDMYEGSDLQKTVRKGAKKVKREVSKVSKNVQRKARTVKKTAAKKAKTVKKAAKKVSKSLKRK